MVQQAHIQEQINSFLAGDDEIILSQDVSRFIPPTIIKLVFAEKKHVAERLIERIITGVAKQEPLPQVCGTCLTDTAKLFAEHEMWTWLDRLLPIIITIKQGSIGSGFASDAIDEQEESLENIHLDTTAPFEEIEPHQTLEERENEIFELAESGRKDEAKLQLYDLVISCARKKDFTNADRLRERIYEIDPMALMEIIQSGEIIEEEKTGSIGKELLNIWSDLLSVLSSAEFNALYHSMEVKNIKPEKTLVAQGTINEELFFINRGCVRASYFQTGTGGEKELFLKNLSGGQIAGENFFNATVWTVSLTAVQPTQVSVLKREALERLEKSYPGIESKLKDYYAKTVDISEMLNKKGLDRRVFERLSIKRNIHMEVIGNQGKILSNFKAEMCDISQGGMAFSVRIPKKGNSRLLLGRTIQGVIPIESGEEFELRGTVIGVQAHESVNHYYTVHVQFLSNLDRNELQLIVS